MNDYELVSSEKELVWGKKVFKGLRESLAKSVEPLTPDELAMTESGLYGASAIGPHQVDFCLFRLTCIAEVLKKEHRLQRAVESLLLHLEHNKFHEKEDEKVISDEAVFYCLMLDSLNFSFEEGDEKGDVKCKGVNKRKKKPHTKTNGAKKRKVRTVTTTTTTTTKIITKTKTKTETKTETKTKTKTETETNTVSIDTDDTNPNYC